MFRMLGITDFPWLMVFVWSVAGLLIGMAGKVVFWRGTSGGQMVFLYYAAVGAGLGGFLGIGYYVIYAVTHRAQL
jgi:hypothetical protein